MNGNGRIRSNDSGSQERTETFGNTNQNFAIRKFPDTKNNT